MNNALLYGLTEDYRASVAKIGEVDLTKLQLTNVERFIPGTNLEMDWESLIFIKNFRRTNERHNTVVWTEKDGFFRTEMTSDGLVNQRMNAGTQNWHEIQTIAEVIGIPMPLPFVLGKTMAIKTSENKSGNHFSWLGVHAVSNLNEMSKDNRVRILLHCGMNAVIEDRVSRLSKKMFEAHEVLRFQQERHAFAIQQNTPVHGGYYPPQARLMEFEVRLYLSFALKLIRKTGFDIRASEAEKLTVDILHNKNQRLEHLDN